MDRETGDRGVSEVVGFLLVFGMVAISFTVYQGVVVPEQNRQVEFQHNQEVQGQFQELRNAIVRTAATGSGEAVSVSLGATYPRRALAANLGTSAGSLGTVEPAVGVHIENVRAEDEETREYLSGTLGPFETKSIRYAPVYSFYGNAPVTVYENGLAYNRFRGPNLTLTDQLVIDDRKITLVAVNGTLSAASRDTVSVSTEAISTGTDRVSVRNTSGGPIRLVFPTGLSAAKWEALLEEELVANGGFVDRVEPVAGADAVAIVLETGTVYELRLAKVGVGSATAGEPAKYVTAVEGDGASVPEGGTRQLVVEVRDRFNNPVSNVTLSTGAGSVEPGTATTGVDGRATFVYSAPPDLDSSEDVGVSISFDGDGTVNETVEFELTVLDSDGSGGGGGGEVNPSGSGSVQLEGQSAVPFGGADVVNLTFDNTGDSAVNVTEARIGFYFDGGQILTNPKPTTAALYATGVGVGPAENTTLPIGGTYEPLSPEITFAADASTTVQLDFDEDVDDTDFYVVSLSFDDGSTNTYFASHP